MLLRMINSKVRWVGHAASMGKIKNAYKILVGSPEGKRALERPRRRWEDNIKIYLRDLA
jgi:hypothetical protein